MKKIILIAGFFAFLTGFYSCTKDTAPSGTVAATCDTSKVSYTMQLVPIINQHCLGSSCHSSGTAQNDFTNFIIVKSDINTILCRIHAAGTSPCGARMPQGLPALPATETALFAKWQTDGFCN